jgi:hypothetical protein
VACRTGTNRGYEPNTLSEEEEEEEAEARSRSLARVALHLLCPVAPRSRKEATLENSPATVKHADGCQALVLLLLVEQPTTEASSSRSRGSRSSARTKAKLRLRSPDSYSLRDYSLLLLRHGQVRDRTFAAPDG